MTDTETCSNCGKEVPNRFSKIHDLEECNEENTLPTAAHEFSKIDHDEEEVWATSKLPPQMLGVNAIEQYELVRRKDVEKLIKERLKKQEERVEKLNGLDRLDLNDAKARREELKKLLEEVRYQ